MVMRTLTTLTIAIWALFASLVPSLAEKRVALVIGNSTYQNVPALKNPKNDATDTSRALKRLGFEVIEGIDLDHQSMQKRIRQFSRALKGADIGLFYYAGHGLQVNGENYLAPVNTTLSDENDLDFETIKLNLILRQMKRSARINLVFLDACRDNPMGQSLSANSRSANIGRGLARVEEESGMLISFATSPGKIALDGTGRNSPFTKALLKNIATENVSVSDMMIEVRKQVMEETKQKQVPWETSSLTGQFYFNPNQQGTQKVASLQPAATNRNVQKEVLVVADGTVDHTFWTSIQDSNDPELYKEYVKRFPNGVFATLAEAKIKAITQSRAITVEAKAETAKPAAPNTQVQTAALTQPVNQALRPQTPPVITLSPQEMAWRLQSELKRVGCYLSGVDGDWGRGSRRAVVNFNRHSGLALAADMPGMNAINQVKSFTARVCPAALSCRRGQYAKNGRCHWRQVKTQPRRAHRSERRAHRRAHRQERRRSRAQRDQDNAVGAAIIGGAIGLAIGLSARRR